MRDFGTRGRFFLNNSANSTKCYYIRLSYARVNLINSGKLTIFAADLTLSSESILLIMN